jgi:tetratricopeptide (TPR) repeat protein
VTQGADGCDERQRQVDDADRLFATAVAKHQTGDLAGAVVLYRQVAALCPEAAAPLINLGFAWQGLGRHDLAIETHNRALGVAPGSAAAWAGVGAAFMAMGQMDQAARSLGRSVRLDPLGIDALNNFGNVLAAQGQIEAAMRVFRRAVRLGPGNPQPYNNLGAALIEAGAIAEGLVACARALVLCPDNPEGENNLGNALLELGRTDEAIAAFRRALVLRPDFPEACTNLSSALIDIGACREAVLACHRAITVQPDDAKAYNNLGNALRGAGALEEAQGVFSQALRLAPEDAEIHYNASSVLLKLGRLQEGWAEYEWRKRTKRSVFRKAPLPGPEWDGAALDGRTLLLYAEQGYGDVLQFVRFAPLMAALTGGVVMLRVYPPLVRLLANLPGISAIVSTEERLPAYHCHLPLMSLPGCLGTVLESIPAAVPYVSPPPLATHRWRDRLADLPGHKVGIVWAGDPRVEERGTYLMDQRRSLSLAAFDEALRIPGLCWVSLQKGAAALQLRTPPDGTTVVDFMDEVGDFADTAALIAALDLVVTVDTSVAHLAGALGKPVWILSRFDGCWRWLEGRTDSPWYPSARLYRQASWGDWSPVLTRLAADLRRLTAGG